MFSDSLQKRVRELHEQNNSKRAISDLISAEYREEIWNTLWKESLSVHYVGKILSDAYKITKNTISDLNDLADENPEHDDDFLYLYITESEWEFWERVTKRVKLDWGWVNDIQFDYVREWHNMSWPKVQQKHNLKPKVWNMLKSRLNLSKDSGICNELYLDIIESKHGIKTVHDIIEDTAERAQNKHGKKMQESINRARERKLSKNIGLVDAQTAQIKEWQKLIKMHKPIKISPKTKNVVRKWKEKKRATIAMSDIHLWENSDVVLSNIAKMTDDMVNMDVDHLDIFCLWDLAESIVMTGRPMHRHQLEHMDRTDPFDLVLQVVDLLEDMLKKVYESWKTATFHGIGGNHDRLWETHAEDINRNWALFIYEFVKRWMQAIKQISVNYYKDKTNAIDVDNIRYVINHGDDWFDKKAHSQPESILRSHGNPEKDNIIMYWHLHHVHIKWGIKDGLVVGVPALASRWNYAKRIDVHADPWYISIKKNKWWKYVAELHHI